MVSGLFGGFTGSYIFSQTIFNLRAGVLGGARHSRVASGALCGVDLSGG